MRVTEMDRGVALVLALVAGACGGGTQRPDPTDRTTQALEQADIPNVSVDWDAEARIAHLKGSVDSVGARERAQDVAAEAVGTSGRVLNELTIAGLNEGRADDLDGRIRSALKDMIDADQVLRDRDMDVHVNNGVVTVKGKVRSAAEKARVSELVRAAPGVKDFANALEIVPPS